MPHYYRIEAVNLSQVLSDTNDLSTRRSGGYLLLQAMHDISDQCAAYLEPISLGASVGLFGLRSGQVAAQARQAIANVLASGLYPLAQFIVTESTATGWPEPVEAMLAQTRWQQMQSLSFRTGFAATAGLNQNPQAAVCDLDGLRPAVDFMDDKKTRVSAAVKARRENGRTLRHSFYLREAGVKEATHFSNSFEQLACYGKHRSAPAYQALPANLDGKMAVFYADGNRFSGIIRRCATAAELTKLDDQMRKRRRSFLQAAVAWVNSHPLGHTQSETYLPDVGKQDTDALRLEVLMWGGDEFLFVLPAWLALELAQLFFKHMQGQSWHGQSLTYSASLVIAHHKAPIARLEALAKYSLAEQGKQEALKGTNTLNWIVLESFDHAGTDIDGYWASRGLPNLNWASMALTPERLGVLCAHLGALRQHLARSAVTRVLHGLRQWSAAGAVDAATRRRLERSYALIHEAISVNPGCADAWRQVWQALQPLPGWDASALFGADAPSAELLAAHLQAWVTLTELWDYVPAWPGAQAQPAPVASTEGVA